MRTLNRYIRAVTTVGFVGLPRANRYAVTFAKDAVPPVNGFWSLTLYNKEHPFEPNRLNRYSLGTKIKSVKYKRWLAHALLPE